MKLPQLSLRDLFWLVLVVAIVLGWWIDRTHLASLEYLWRFRAEGLKDIIEGTSEDTVEWTPNSVVVSGPDTTPP